MAQGAVRKGKEGPGELGPFTGFSLDRTEEMTGPQDESRKMAQGYRQVWQDPQRHTRQGVRVQWAPEPPVQPPREPRSPQGGGALSRDPGDQLWGCPTSPRASKGA